MNAGLIILRVASERRDAQNEHDGAGLRSSVTAATPSQQQLRRSSTTSLQPSTQLVVSSSRPSSRCCWQHLKEGRGDTSRRDASCAQHSSVAAASAGDGSVPTMSGRRRLFF